MKHLALPPNAPTLLESMRAIGYDAAAAIADLVDNSITAGATRVDIRFNPGTPCHFAILDNGCGMDQTELKKAMRHGSRNPNDPRAENDLGRFGLGLKTASMSQCRRLTVVSRKQGFTHAMVWDLDDVAAKNDWVVGVLDSRDIASLPFIEELQALSSGTLVIWQKLDQLAAGDRGDGAVLSDRMRDAADHLALVLHRYLSGRPPELTIAINHHPVTPRDPFLEQHGSNSGPEESILVDGYLVTLRAYTLPHISRLTRSQIEEAGGEVGLRRQQGFYIYRNRRLIVWGTWFRLFRQEELTKLTRVRVDIPNSLDHLWSLDIKKSTASPPPLIRDRLKGLVPTLVRPSRQAHQYRGRITTLRGIRPIWRRIEDRDGIRYEVDPEHPVIAALRESIIDDSLAIELDNVLQAISRSLPIELLYNDRANDLVGHRPEPDEEAEAATQLEELGRQMLGAFSDRPQERQRLLAELGSLEPFSLYPSLLPLLKERLSS